jgi:phage baseplate assembly protein W
MASSRRKGDGAHDHLGKGVRFPVTVNLTGGISSSSFEDNVRQSLFVILGTAPGERLMRPEFGCRIHDLMFAPNNHATAALARYYCEEAIYKFEPRVARVKVTAEACATDATRLDLHIDYELAGKPGPRSLVYPFYLRSAADDGAEKP